MNILILGGTAFFGKDMVRLLHGEGHSVSLFTRGKTVPHDLPPVRHFKGDRKNPADLRKTLQGTSWDVVIDNIAYNALDVGAALDIFKECGRYILTSTVSVYRFAKSQFPQPYREGDIDFDAKPALEGPADVHWQYARGKMEAERACLRQKQVAWTILRPPIVYGPNEGVDARGFWYLERLLSGGPIILANGGLNASRLVYSVDVARSFLRVIEQPNTIGKIYNVAQDEIITLRNFIDESARVLNVKPDYVSIPLDYLKMHNVGEFAGEYAFANSWIQDIAAAKKDFDYRPTPFSQFCPSTAVWYRDNWRGSKEKLLATRPQEIELARKWIQALKCV